MREKTSGDLVRFGVIQCQINPPAGGYPSALPATTVTKTAMGAYMIDTATWTPADRARAESVEKKLNGWMAGSSGPYDSVVIVGGNGITANAFAARLARDQRFAGKVVLAAPQKGEDQRLKAGVSLRAYAADFLSYSVGLGHTELIEAIDPTRTIPASTRQQGAMATSDDDGNWSFSKKGTWQMHRGHSSRPVMYGFRNSRMAAAVREQIADGSVIYVQDAPSSLQAARELAPGRNPLIVNASNKDTLLGNAAGSHDWGIIAAQVPFAVDGALRQPLERATTFAPLVHRDGTIDVGYFTPFQDAATPEAAWYGIMARPVPAAKLHGADAESEKQIITDELLGIGRECGLRPAQLDKTLGVAAVPGAGWKAPGQPRVASTFELKQSCSGGVPAYYADGILCGSVGGLAAAEAILRGADPTASAANAIRTIRRWNYLWWFETTKVPALADRLMRINVSAAMIYPHSSSVKSWVSMA